MSVSSDGRRTNNLSKTDRDCVINIGGALAENSAKGSNEANYSNFNECDGQRIEIAQSATAIVNNYTVVMIGTQAQANLILNDADKVINIEVTEDGGVSLNGEKMDIKELKNGVKVMLINNEFKQETINKKQFKNEINGDKENKESMENKESKENGGGSKENTN